LPSDVASVILSATLVLLVTREERRHATQRSFTHFHAIGQACGPGHATANPLFSCLSGGESSLAVLSAQLKAAPCSISYCLGRGEAFSVAP